MRIPNQLLLLAAAIAAAGIQTFADYGEPVSVAGNLSFTNIPADAQAKIDSAMPKRTQASPGKSRKVLIFNLHIRKGEVMTGHPSVPYFNYALAEMGKRTGAYTADFGTDPALFTEGNLEEYDAIIFNNTAGVLTEDPELQWGLLDYIYSGGGFIGVHAAGATFCQWPDYDIFPAFGEMLGGFENGGHPWKPHEWINLKMDDPNNPVVSAFQGKNFDVSDEVFQFSKPYSRNRLRVLMSIDTSRTDMNPDRRILPERLADGDIAISWIKKYGRGNVFYSSLGHNVHLAWDSKVLQHYLDGIQFVIGDLNAPTTPSAKLTPAMLAQEQLDWRLGAEAYTFKDRSLFETIEAVDQLGLAYIGGLNVQNVSPGIDKPLAPGLSDNEIRQIRQKLVLHGLNMLTYFHFDLPGNEAECRKVFEFARKLGVEVIISEPKPEDLDLIEQMCEEYNIKVALHNHGKRLSPEFWNPDNILKLCKDRSPLVGAACDFGYWVREGIDPLPAIKRLGKRVITLQIHDLNALREDAHDVPWGSGSVDLDGILEYLKEEDIQPVMFGLEYSRDWGKSLPAIKQSIRWFNQQTLKLANDAN